MAFLEGPGFYLSKRVGRAMTDYKMLEDGDKVAVAVSGGKDSLALLKILKERQSFVPIKYSLIALHIDLGHPRSLAVPLRRYFEKEKIPFHIVKVDILKKTKKKDIDCFWCSWNRRKSLFETAIRLGCRKVALGHHKDDIIETMLLNLFFHGEISAMSPKQELFKGKILLIRPLAHVEESLIKKFAKENKLPVQDCRCPQSLISSRQKMARIISGLKRSCPDVKTNIFRSIQRIKTEYLP